MTLYRQDSGSAYNRYGALPSVCDSTALDEIELYGDLLQVVAEHPCADKRLSWTVIDRALGLKPGGTVPRPATRRQSPPAGESGQ